MSLIGFQYNCSMRTDPRRRLSPSLLNRVVLIDSYLRERGNARIFFYSPKHVDGSGSELPGYLIEGGHFLPSRAHVPRVNGNWTYRTRRLLRKGLGFDGFAHWAAASGVGIFVPHAFSELVNNKLEAYKLVSAFHETLHPYCEAFRNSVRQLEHFSDIGHTTFVKPRRGNQGDRIITIRRTDGQFRLTYYEKGRKQEFTGRRLSNVLKEIRGLTGTKRKYVIQHGIDTLRHDGSVFDIRVVMLHDGSRWHWLHEVRRSPKGSDVSNVRQGGESVDTHALLYELLGGNAVDDALQLLRDESFGLATYLERLHPGELPEVAFDFALDVQGRLRLLEINTKPGMVGLGSDVHYHVREPRQEASFKKDVYPHARFLTDFLYAKLLAQPR